MEETTTVTIGTIMEDVGTVFESAIGMVGTVAETVVSHPILFLGTIIGLCVIGVAFFNRIRR